MVGGRENVPFLVRGARFLSGNNFGRNLRVVGGLCWLHKQYYYYYHR